ncbi:MAG: hypothetical protein KF745_07255 [Phycisphaeraceae bacterium]|nr:hypothetical protein [Phycisphaeraceae bacterium]
MPRIQVRCCRVESPAARILAACACAVSLTGVSLAQQPEAKPAAAGDDGRAPVFVLERAALGKFVVDPRDAGLARAMGMLPARLRELPRELPDFDAPPSVIDMLITAAESPARIAVTFDGEDASGGMFGGGVVMSLLTGEQAPAVSIQGTITALLKEARSSIRGKKSATYSDMLEAGVPVVGMLRYGPRKAADGWRYEIHAGTHAEPDSPFSSLPAPARPGFEPVLRMHVSLAPLVPLVEMGREAAAGNPEAEHQLDRLAGMGLIGENAMSYDYQFGYLPDRGYAISTTHGFKPYAATMMVGTVPLTPAEIDVIPADAYVAGVYSVDLSSSVAESQRLRDESPALQQALAEFKGRTGVDPITDLLGNLGGTAGYYMADSTGGEGLLSAVAFVGLKDRAAFDSALLKVESAANAELARPTKGYVRIRSWKESEARFSTISFPGVPVPLEITYTTTPKYLVFALSPQAALAAARQAMGQGDGGLGSNPAFAGSLPKDRPLVAVSFVDTPRTMLSGYQFVCLGGSMLSNLVRSPSDPSRDPGMVVPLLSELRKNARPSVSFSYFDGDNFVKECYSDRSLLAGAAGSLGAASPLIPVIAATAAGMGFAAQREMNRYDEIDIEMDEDDAVEMNGGGR